MIDYKPNTDHGMKHLALMKRVESLEEGINQLGTPTHLVTDTTSLHPLSDPGLGLFELVVVGSVDEVTALVVEKVKNLVDSVFIAGTHTLLPSISEVHRTETKRAHTN